MELTRKIKAHGNLDTDLYLLLSNIPDEFLFHQEHTNFRHPLGLYNISSSKVYDNFENSINAFNEYCLIKQQIKHYKGNEDSQKTKNKESNEKQKKLHKNYRELFYSLAEYVDTTLNILKCFYPQSTVKKNEKFTYRWLIKADESTYNFYYQKIEDYRTHLFSIVNKMKHNDARMGETGFDTTEGTILGYFIEGVNQDGAICPNPEIHSKYKGMSTSISFNRDFKYHFINYFLISHHLKVTIERLLKKKYGKKIILKNHENNKDGLIISIASNLVELPNLFFVDEYEKDLPVISIDREQTELNLKLSSSKINRQYQLLSAYNSFHGDGASRKFEIPYRFVQK